MSSQRGRVAVTHAGGPRRSTRRFARPVRSFSCSAPRLPDDLIKTADDIYIRFHGKERWYRHDYTKDELTTWKDRILASGAKRAWIYFNNDFEALYPVGTGTSSATTSPCSLYRTPSSSGRDPLDKTRARSRFPAGKIGPRQLLGLHFAYPGKLHMIMWVMSDRAIPRS